jgi:AcrR family transcriptional regulator
MSDSKSRWDLSEIEVSKSASDAALHVVERLKRQKEKANAHWATAVRLAHANGASLRDIAQAAGVSPQTIANLCSEPRK